LLLLLPDMECGDDITGGGLVEVGKDLGPEHITLV
jgi:hypothetical protein